MITYEFDHGSGIFKFHFLGPITIQDLFDNAATIRANEHIPKDAKLLAYADKADFVFSTDELKKFGDYLANSERRFNSVKEAFIVARPKETALAFLFAMSSAQMDHFKFKSFSTEEAALAWLQE